MKNNGPPPPAPLPPPSPPPRSPPSHFPRSQRPYLENMNVTEPSESIGAWCQVAGGPFDCRNSTQMIMDMCLAGGPRERRGVGFWSEGMDQATAHICEHPNPTTVGSKMGGEFTYQPKWDPKTVLTHSHDPGSLWQAKGRLFGLVSCNELAKVSGMALGCFPTRWQASECKVRDAPNPTNNTGHAANPRWPLQTGDLNDNLLCVGFQAGCRSGGAPLFFCWGRPFFRKTPWVFGSFPLLRLADSESDQPPLSWFGPIDLSVPIPHGPEAFLNQDIIAQLPVTISTACRLAKHWPLHGSGLGFPCE